MNSPVFIDYTAVTPQPWKNGRGITRNLFDDSDRAGQWSWRISIAEITGTQPYSRYPGVRRGQVALGPGAVELTLNGEITELPVEGTIVFDGEEEVSATPHGEGFLDLNVMVARARWTPHVSIVHDPELQVPEDGIWVVVALEDSCTFGDQRFDRLDALLLTSGAHSGVGRFVLARIIPAR
ncbi:HutD family protein [Glutamicibacter endophyticus]|uniref:HutD/Ves family protein n=1 Tax=Glutamicibacter endophyticus TaxID=1522174 RepID=UPI003AF0CB62